MIKLPSESKKNAALGIALGVVYGIALRVGFESPQLQGFLQIISTAFLIGAPFGVGVISVFIASGAEKISLRRQIAVSVTTMLFFLLAMFIFLLEGLICIVLVAPVFIIASMIGGVVAGAVVNRLRASRATVSSLAILPLLLGPLEAYLPAETSEQTVSTSIRIQAPPEVVFDRLASVKNIGHDELGFSFVHLIGLPRPVEAAMDGHGMGSIRTSRWEKNVRFKEEITQWERPVRLHYKFHIPAGSIPRDALDRHVELGGDYFTVIDGGYDLEESGDGGTTLTLTTRFLNKSHLKLYGDLWGKMVLNDFHHSILGLMKNRAEMAHKAAVTDKDRKQISSEPLVK